MRRVKPAGVFVCVSLAAGAPVLAGPVFLDPDAQPVNRSSDEVVEARFRADTTNWDVRLESSSFPVVGDNQGNVRNGGAAFRNSRFGVELAFDSDSSRLTWTVDDGGDRTELPLLAGTGSGGFNAIQMFVSGSRAPVTFADIAFDGFGETISREEDLVGGWDEAFLVLGDGRTLFDESWTLSGTVAFGDYSHWNPSEGAKLNIKLIATNAVVIPGPGVVAVGAAGLAVLARRRRC